MKFCTHCGAHLGDDARFCTSCGTKTDDAPVSPVAPVPPASPASAPESAIQAAPVQNEPVILVKNDTQLTPNTLKKFYKDLKDGSIAVIVIGILLLFMSLFLLTLRGYEEDDFVFWVCGVVFIVCGALILWMYYAVYTKNKIFTERTHTLYLCDEEGVTQILLDGERETARSWISYAQISKVTKKKEYILLRLGASVWLIDRNAFTLGTEADFVALLKRRCAPKSVKIK